jgi:glucose-6-phosphate dehydrogenase assembly protein OpcA
METAVTLKIAEIEQQLRDIWKGFSKDPESDQAITRAQVMNFVVFTSTPSSEPEITTALADISEQSPGRMIVLIRDRDLPSSKLHSWVNALCHLASGGRKQICCEQIMIHAGERDVAQWSSMVLPLLIPDLPVFLWWKDRPDAARDLLHEIAESCDRMIIDTQDSPNYSDIVSLMNARGVDLAISDLNWSRITPWRLGLAGFYDHPQCRISMDDLVRIEIDSRSPYETAGQSHLLLAWLASSLQWERAGESAFLNANGNSISVQRRWQQQETDQLLSVRLFSNDGHFSVSLLPDESHLQTEVRIRDKKVGGQVLQIQPGSVSALLSREVLILTHDVVFERAVKMLAKSA